MLAVISFYATAKRKQVRWDRPEADPYFIETELFLKYSRREIKKLKACYSHMDWDSSMKISLDEFKDILGEIGEHKLRDDEKKLKGLWKAAEKDDFGEIGKRRRQSPMVAAVSRGLWRSGGSGGGIAPARERWRRKSSNRWQRSRRACSCKRRFAERATAAW